MRNCLQKNYWSIDFTNYARPNISHLRDKKRNRSKSIQLKCTFLVGAESWTQMFSFRHANPMLLCFFKKVQQTPFIEEPQLFANICLL